jgi:hypothetical protein
MSSSYTCGGRSPREYRKPTNSIFADSKRLFLGGVQFRQVYPQAIHVDDVAMIMRADDLAENDRMQLAERSTNKQMHVAKAPHRE